MKSFNKEYKKDIEKAEKLMGHFKFKEPIPPEVRKEVISSRKRLFKRIAKTLGILTIGYSIYLSIYFFFKKLGLTKFFISLFVATTVTTGTIITVKYVQNKNSIKPISLEVSPKVLVAKKSNVINDIKIITIRSDKTKNDITLFATFTVTPKDLARVLKNEKQGSAMIVFNKEGKGELNIAYKKLRTTIAIVHSPNIKNLTPLQKLHKQYKHVEKVLLADGTVLTGVLIDKGDGNVKLILPNKTLHLKKSDVVKSEIIKP